MNYDWQIWWTDAGVYQNQCYFEAGAAEQSGTFDAGYGVQNVQNTDGTVFVYTHSLPVYLSAVYYFVAVGGSLDPNFTGKYKDRLLECSQQLHLRHDYIFQNGLIELLPTDWTNLPGIGLWTNACWGPDPASGLNDTSKGRGVRLLYSSPVDLAHSLPTVLGARIEYGVVERFSGCSSMGDNSSVITSKPANGDQVKTGQRERPGQNCFTPPNPLAAS